MSGALAWKPVEESLWKPVGEIPGTEKLGGKPPTAGQVPVPEELKPETEPSTFGAALKDFITSPRGLIRTGLNRATEGIEAGAEPGINPKLHAASEVIRGLGTAAAPAAIGAGIAAPIPTAVGMAAGLGGQYAAEHAAPLVGASPEASAFAGDMAGLAAGGLAHRIPGLGVPKGLISRETVPTAGELVTTAISPKAGLVGYARRQIGRLGEKPAEAKGPEVREVVNPYYSEEPAEPAPIAAPIARKPPLWQQGQPPQPAPSATTLESPRRGLMPPEPKAPLPTPILASGRRVGPITPIATKTESGKVVPINERPNTITSPETAGPDIHQIHAQNRSTLAQDMAEWMHSKGTGISHEDALAMQGPQRQMVLNAVRPKSGPSDMPDQNTWELALERLKTLEGTSGKTPARIAPAKPKGLSGNSLRIAQQLSEAMQQ